MATDSRTDVLRLDINVDPDDPDDDVAKVMEKIHPEWKRGDLKRKTLGENAAMVNKMYVYYVTENSDDAIVVRIYGTEYEEYSNRDREISATLLLNEMGVSPKVRCIFKNGMCMEYVKGKTYDLIDRKTFSDKELACAVARELALIHCQKASSLAIEKYGFTAEMESALEALDLPLQFWGPETDKLDPLVTSPEFPTKAELRQEVDLIKPLVLDLGMPIVMSHNDLHPGNAIYDASKDKAILVDFEYSFYNVQGWDLAQYLFHSAFGYGLDEVPPELHPSSYKEEFLRNYLESLSRLDDWGREVTDDDVDVLLGKVDKTMLFVMLTYIPIILIVAAKPPKNYSPDFNWCRGALNAWKVYKAMKKEILG